MELALTQDTRRQVETATMADAASTAGFAALGMVSGRADGDARAVLDAAGLRCHELLGLQVTANLEAATGAAELLAADATAVGAPWVLATFEVGLSEDVIRTVERCAAAVADAGAGLAVEFSPLGPVSGLGDALDLVAAVGPGRVAVVIDSWNFCFGPSTWHDLDTVPFESIAYLQFADALAPLGEVDMVEAMTRRALPGDGVLELDRFVATLRDRGWDGVVSAQVLSDDLRQLPIEEYAARVHEATARYWL